MSQILRLLTQRPFPEMRRIAHQRLAVDLFRCSSCSHLRHSWNASRAGKPGIPTLFSRGTSSAKISEQVGKWKQFSGSQKRDPRSELTEVLETRYQQLESQKKAFRKQTHASSLQAPDDAWKNSVISFEQQMEKSRNADQDNIDKDQHDIKHIDFTQQKGAQLSMERSSEIDDAKSKDTSSLSNEHSTKSEKTETKKKKKRKKKQSKAASNDVDTVTQAEQFLKDLESNLTKEVHDVLCDAKTDKQMVRKLEKYLSDLIQSGKLPTQAYKVPFWKPESLVDMSEIKDGLQVVEKLSQMSQLHTMAIEKEMERQANAKNKHYMKEVNAYVDVCLHTGLVRRAYAALGIKELNKKARYKSKKLLQDYTITDPALFNKVLGALAKKQDMRPMKRLLKQMQDTGVAPTFQTYVTFLEFYGRQNPIDVNSVEETLSSIKDSGFNLKELRKECSFQKDELEYVLKAIEALEPEFVPSKLDELPNYECPLLNNLRSRKPKAPVSNPHKAILSLQHLQNQAQRQLKMEQKGFVTIGTILPKNTESIQVQNAKSKLQEAKQSWKMVLDKAFKRDVAIEDKKKQNMQQLSVVPYLKLFPHATFVKLMMQEIDTIALETESFSPSLGILQRELGRRVNHHYLTHDRLKSGYVRKFSQVYQEYLKDYLEEYRTHPNDRECWQSHLNRLTDGAYIETKPKTWPPLVSRMVGRWLYNLILMDIKIDANLLKNTDERHEIPAFYTVYRQEGPIIHECIKPHPLLVRLYRSAQIEELSFDTYCMPLLTPPIPWHSVSSGANLMSTTNLIINPTQSWEQTEKLYHLPGNKLHPVFDALNALSATPWRINQPILDHVINVFNAGGDPSLTIPSPSTSFDAPPKITLEMTDEEKLEVLIERQRIKKEQQEMHSLWMTQLYRLSIANHYRDEVFWFPHNMDFRSRVYATPPHFNHLGSDLARSLLIFAQGKKLGTDGLDWLKIHLINLTGFKKRSSNAERLTFANEVIPEIMDSADKPWEGRKWWQTSDEPWQTLACCMEITKAVRSNKPEDYVCRYPVHQDGSCNGLQHYAALGRDQAGAQSVNLFPYTHPKDVYSDVVDLVEVERRKDAKEGVEIATILENFIKRKVIKQTIMTTVYGVTRFGARLQIERQLQDVEDFPKDKVFDASLYLTQKTFYCLQKMFTSTKEIQDWFTVCAKIVSGIFYRPMQWETPLGWPVIQPYYRNFNPAHVIPKLGKCDPIEVPNTMRQKNGFPPNFIHSLDSTHMMLTAIFCQNAGVSFVSVHDCFWTHASDVAVMNKICREQFVSLHSQAVLEDLALFMYRTYGFHPGDDMFEKVDPLTKDFINHVLLRVPARGAFDLKKVSESTYFFS